MLIAPLLFFLVTFRADESQISSDSSQNYSATSEAIIAELQMNSTLQEAVDQYFESPLDQRRIRIGELMKNAEEYDRDSIFKVQLLDFLIDQLLSSETDEATKVYISAALGRFKFLDVEITEQSRSRLVALYEKPLELLTKSDVEIISAYEVPGYEIFLNNLLSGRFGVDQTSDSILYGGDIFDVSEAEWAALIAKAQLGDGAAIEQSISIVESSPLKNRIPLILEVAKSDDPYVSEYLDYYLFSDEEITVVYDVPNSTAPIAWFVIPAIADRFDDFPISIPDSIPSTERMIEDIKIVREWVESRDF